MKKPSLKIRLMHFWFRLTRATTLGVRIFFQNEKGELLLVKHGYVNGWHLPGGGVEVGDTGEATVRKELLEETGLEVVGEIKLISIYANQKASRRDHVLLYKVESCKRGNEFKSNWEIKEVKFFDAQALPIDTTQSTRNRIDEILSGKPFDLYW